ncbi:unnamed protein product [Cyclocybe aegerita]|uniref:valine--tRNA ligase n=1 Tax=Cyclocybe aegerita TaxID=1973307 RepID=A0A8S0WZH7_CYCAE|nr:unnamed protein product [Cyclocybe aegerita]
MDENLSKFIIETFCRLHEDSIIYHANRLVNWCTKLNTTLSDLEVDQKELEGRTLLSMPRYDAKEKFEFGVLTSFVYEIEGSDERIVIATTRPETMLGDTAIAVHPDDPRYTHLHGKFVKHPFVPDRKMPIVTDGIIVDMAFGTGAVKITPAHDQNDYDVGKWHNLEFINILNNDGMLNANAGERFQGMKWFHARVKVVEALKELGLFMEMKDNKMMIPLCRTDVADESSKPGDIIEPLLKPQWWVDCKPLADEAIKFCNKIFNATKFAMLKLDDSFVPLTEAKPTGSESLVEHWILHKLNVTATEINDSLAERNFMAATNAAYNFWLYELCDVYIEAMKPMTDEAAPEAVRRSAQQTLYVCLDHGLRLLHPFMPFVTEELWQCLPRHPNDLALSIMVSMFSVNDPAFVFEGADKDFDLVFSAIKTGRSLAASYTLQKDMQFFIQVQTEKEALFSSQVPMIIVLSKGCESTKVIRDATVIPAGCGSAVVTSTIIIHTLVQGLVDLDNEISKCNKKLDLARLDLGKILKIDSEGHESEPFELKSDDIVEFGIDIIGEDNKTIIHHKVTARIVCVFSEQDAQVAARAEQHQQQQHLQQQQYLQQQASTSGLGGPSSLGPSVNGVNGSMGAQGFPFASAQWRAQLAQQGLGGMGGMRPPGKTGLSFEVVLSRLQGELQKSRETGAELTSLTGAMGDICDMLGGNVPSALPLFPATLPPIQPQDLQPPPQQGSSSAPAPHGTSSPSPPSSDPPAASSIPVAAISDIQAQLRDLRDSQSMLTARLEWIQALEGVVDEQENVRREVRALRGLLEERSQEEELLQRRVREHHEQELRDGFDEDEEEMVGDDDDDDVRSISTVIPHKLEQVDEEDEEGLEDAHHLSHDSDLTHNDSGESHNSDAHAAEHTEENAKEQERRRAEDLEVSQSWTPEPTWIMGSMRESESYPGSGPPRTGLLGAPGMARQSSVGSLLSQEVSSTSETISDPSTSNAVPAEEIYAQLSKLSQQVGAVVALTTSLEAQHSKAQNVIKELEDRVGMLEGLLKEARGVKDSEPVEPEPSRDTKHLSLVSMITEWKKSIEGQWTAVQEEWTSERERLVKAREEWETKANAVDSGLERIDSGVEKIAKLQEKVDSSLLRLGKVEEGFKGTFKIEERVGKVEDRTEKLEGMQRSWGDER